MGRINCDLENISKHHQVLIVGGGATGIGIFRDLSLHGVNSLLVEARDFCSQTSSKSSKMLHGGIRYLETLDFGLVREALHEKNLWLKLAPHLAQELPFHLPVYWESKYPFLWMTKFALKTYDFLSSYENSPHKILSPEETFRSLPGIKRDGLKGTGVYYDAIMDDVKLGLECLYDALLEPNQTALNYVNLEKLTPSAEGYTATLKDYFTGLIKEVSCDYVIFATGPFTDKVMAQIGLDIKWSPKLIPSKGSHLWLRKNSIDALHPLVLQCFDGRIIFVIPERDAILVGTTEVKPDEDFFDTEISEEEIDYLLKNLAEFFPTSKVSRKDILSTFSGIRPLVSEGDQNAHKASRHHKVFRPMKKIYTIVGGKWTTFRVMGQEISQEIVHDLGGTYRPNLTLRELRAPSTFPTFTQSIMSEEKIFQSIKQEKPRTFQDLLVRRIGVPNEKHWHYSQDMNEFFSSIQNKLEHLLIMDK